MLESTKKTVTHAKLMLIATIAILVLSVSLWLILQFAVGSEKLGFPALLSLFIAFFVCEGFFCIQIGIFKKKAYVFAGGSILFVIGLLFTFIATKLLWWVALIICIAALIVAFFGTMLIKAPELAVEMDNAEGSGHKTYFERKAEEEAEKKDEEPVELPQIKSFKD